MRVRARAGVRALTCALNSLPLGLNSMASGAWLGLKGRVKVRGRGRGRGRGRDKVRVDGVGRLEVDLDLEEGRVLLDRVLGDEQQLLLLGGGVA